MCTSAGSESAFIFRMTWPRCAFTVISLMPSSPPTCLFKRPEATRTMTSRSRGVRAAYFSRSACIFAACSNARRLRSRACRIALNSTWSPNGLVRNSTAPAFIAWTLVETSPFPVTKMTGMLRPFGGDALLEIQTVEVRQGDVEDQAARNRRRGTCEKLLRRCECLAAASLIPESAIPAIHAPRRRRRRRTPRALHPIRAAS